ncbi:MAG: discoidin domain-containing protein [Archangiaceae bacterium]|nr:discoidin domain-containing protein [Archangiaceae bacterium]
MSASRERLWQALVALAPRGTVKSWQSLARAAPIEVDRELVERLSVSPPEAGLASSDVLDAAAERFSVLAETETRRQRQGLMRKQGGAIAGLMVGLWCASAGVLAANRLLDQKDFAKGQPWRASSSWGTCDPEHGMCGPLHSRIFFHTLADESPWVEIDLGKPQTFTSLTVINRKDEHLEDRAVPLVIEVGDDQQTWREIARRDEVFTTWKPSFAPVTARFVRARVTRKSWLHLEAVKVHP